MSPDVALSDRERAIVNAFQGGFPVVERPFEPAAAALRERGIDVSATALLETIRTLDEREIISRFGPLIDAEEIGGTAVLVAASAPDDRLEEVAEAINARREVAHNYERDHPELNLWFVVSVADEDRVSEVLSAIEAETGTETYAMPKRREFELEATFPVDGPLSDAVGGERTEGTDDAPDREHVGVDLSRLGSGRFDGFEDFEDFEDFEGSGDDPGPDTDPTTEPGRDHTGTPDSLSPAERDLVLEVQDGLPLTETPYADVAAAIGREPAWVRGTIRRFDREGKIRRIGIVPNHYALGYTENGMTVWDVSDDLVPEVGRAVGSLPFVTHCYERPRHDGVWSYNLFAMVHGRTEAECHRRIDRVYELVADHEEITEDEWGTLFSTRILKKSGIRLPERVEANTRRTSPQ